MSVRRETVSVSGRTTSVVSLHKQISCLAFRRFQGFLFLNAENEALATVMAVAGSGKSDGCSV